MKSIQSIQRDLQELNIDGWLLVNHHAMDPIANDLLGFPSATKTSRRWWYYIPRTGVPTKLVHSVEPLSLQAVEGTEKFYCTHQSLRSQLGTILESGRTVAMQYSPEAQLPMISLVDGGTIELVRSYGICVVSSAELLQRQYAQLADDQIASHVKAMNELCAIKDQAFEWIRQRTYSSNPITDHEVQQFIVSRFSHYGLTCDGNPPIVGVNENAANPHFSVDPTHPVKIRPGDRLLLDLWARKDHPRSVYADICWCAFLGDNPPQRYADLFRIVVKSRDRAILYLKEELGNHRSVTGASVDQSARAVFEENRVTELSVHRTGHSIDTSVHGRGANIDSYETNDTRQIIARSCFSIEPALYETPIGVRTEINVLIDSEGSPRVFGELQRELTLLRTERG